MANRNLTPRWSRNCGRRGPPATCWWPRLEMALVEDAGVVNPQPIPAWRQWIAPTAGLAALLVALPRQPATQNSPDAANPGMNKVLPHAAAALIPPQTEAPKSLDLKPVAMENRVVGAVDDGVFNNPRPAPHAARAHAGGRLLHLGIQGRRHHHQLHRATRGALFNPIGNSLTTTQET